MRSSEFCAAEVGRWPSHPGGAATPAGLFARQLTSGPRLPGRSRLDHQASRARCPWGLSDAGVACRAHVVMRELCYSQAYSISSISVAGTMASTRRLAAILAADVAGYSRLMGVDEEGRLERLKALRRELIDPKIAAQDGRIGGASCA